MFFSFISRSILPKSKIIFQKRYKSILNDKLKNYLYGCLEYFFNHSFISHYNELQKQIESPNLSQDDFIRISKEAGKLSSFASLMNKYKNYENEIKELEVMINDPKCENEIKEMAKEEKEATKSKLEEIEDEVILQSLPKDDADDKNAIMEFRPGAGGEEAGLFAFDIYNMYVQYAEQKKWKVETLSLNYNAVGGLREGIISIIGENAYERLKYESGVHRVQRVPTTEVSNRTHTSTMSVVVLPKINNVDLVINPRDLRIDVYRSSGAGGQSVNKTESAVRITHIPTGISVAIQDERSQLRNREKAMSILMSRVYKHEQEKKEMEIERLRSSQIGTMKRCERIRTYNKNQDRVTDHRIGMSFFGYEKILSGIGLDEIITNLHEKFQKAALSDFFEQFS